MVCLHLQDQAVKNSCMEENVCYTGTVNVGIRWQDSMVSQGYDIGRY